LRTSTARPRSPMRFSAAGVLAYLDRVAYRVIEVLIGAKG
jgi:hypothetical protein